MSGIKYTSQINMQVPPTEDNHVVRKKDLEDYAVIYWGIDDTPSAAGHALKWEVI